jgi:hypothetical protein
MTSLRSTRRTNGATTRTIGKATGQDDSQAVSQVVTKFAENPAAIKVESPEMIKDIKQESKKPKAICSNRAGINGFMFSGL